MTPDDSGINRGETLKFRKQYTPVDKYASRESVDKSIVTIETQWIQITGKETNAHNENTQDGLMELQRIKVQQEFT